MTSQEYDRRMTKTIGDMEKDRSKMMVYIGTEARKLIFERVHDTGVDAKGQKYAPYSTRPMLTNCSTMILSACSKVAGSKEKRKELKWVTVRGHKLFELPGGYKEFRQLHGRQTDHVDFSFTGKMWNNINLISSTNEHQQGVVIIGARTDEEKKKLEGNTKRKGDILDLSNKELTYLSEKYKVNTLEIIRNNGL